MIKNRPIKMKLYFLFLLFLTILCSCTPKTGEADRLGSWGQINQSVIRGAEWKWIVAENLVMKDTPMISPETVMVIEGMGMLVETVAEYKNNNASIGYTYKYYIDTLYKNENIKILKIDGISSDEKNLRTNLYPFTTCYYGVIRSGEENSSGGIFLDWMLSREGQQCIQQAGYIPYVEY